MHQTKLQKAIPHIKIKKNHNNKQLNNHHIDFTIKNYHLNNENKYLSHVTTIKLKVETKNNNCTKDKVNPIISRSYKSVSIRSRCPRGPSWRRPAWSAGPAAAAARTERRACRAARATSRAASPTPSSARTRRRIAPESGRPTYY